MVETLVGIVALVSALVTLLAGFGVLRFDDLYARMHAATKATALGVLLSALAAAIGVDDGRGNVVLAAVFILITSPVAAHFVGRAAYRAEGIDIDLEGPDELRALIDETYQSDRE